MSIFGEFRTFAMRGNVVDLAVGLVIGASFGRIVTAMVDGLLMPVLGLLVGGVHFGELALTLKAARLDAAGEVIEPAVRFAYGAFLQATIDFVIIAFAIFLLVRAMNRLKRKEEAKPPEQAVISPEVKLLTEIRDALIAR
jgi:large conductance mechanosensitive channel